MNYGVSLVAGLLLLAGCKKDEAPSAPARPVIISVHVTASCPGIVPSYAVISNVSREQVGGASQRFFQLSYAKDQVDETRVVLESPGAEYAGDSLQASIALPGPYASFSIPANGFAQVDILVNGQVRKTARVDSRTAIFDRNPYLQRSAYLRFKDL
jgi:hypothetical protein